MRGVDLPFQPFPDPYVLQQHRAMTRALQSLAAVTATGSRIAQRFNFLAQDLVSQFPC